ncbi:MAG: signal peptidase I [Lachnospiraceae bacterium]|nr:signal peptidase I [Lachnospiraceae bacterium]
MDEMNYNSTDEIIKDENIDYETNKAANEEVEEKLDIKKEIMSWISILVIAVVAAAILDNFVIINANVPSGSMENTIMTGDRMIGNRLAYINDAPERGDVVIFKFPDNEEENFVKRVIGLPGEKVTIRDAHVYIDDNETPLEEPYLPEEWLNSNDGLEFNVPADSYFVMGDNRNISNDARFWNNTYVKKDKIIAKAVVIYWPMSDAGLIDGADYSVDKK